MQVAFFMPGFIFGMYQPFDLEGERICNIPASIVFVLPQRQLVRGSPLKPLVYKTKGAIYMRNRNVKIQIWLSKKEAENLQKKAKRSNISVAAYLRHLINDMVPQDAPPPDYYSMMQQLYRIGNSLNQITQKAHTLNVIDVQRYDDAYRQFETAVKEITEAVVQPKPMGQ